MVIYRDSQNKAVKFPLTLDPPINGTATIQQAAWLSDKDPTDYGLTGPHEIVRPEFNEATQKLVKQPSGDFEAVDLTAQELDDRKPKVVTMRQARLALLSQKLLSNVDAVIASFPSPQKEAAQIEWEFASTVERNSDLVAMLSQSLSLTDEQMDALFQAASEL